MLKILLSALLVAVSVAEDICCTPEQWQGRVGAITGTAVMGKSSVIQADAAVYYDYRNKMLAAEFEYTVHDMTFKNKTIINYNDKLMYMIGGNGGECKITSIRMDMMEACIPAGSEERGPFYYGAGANNTLMADAYRIKIDLGQGEPLTAEIAVTAVDCVPIAEVVYGQIGPVAMMTTAGFANIVPKITNPAVFDPPEVCQNVKPTETKMPFQSMSFTGFPSLHHFTKN